MAPEGATTNLAPVRTQSRVLRGGSWNNNPNNLRCANRNNNEPTNRNNNIGFRCAQDAGKPIRMPEFGCLRTTEARMPPSRVRSGLASARQTNKTVRGREVACRTSPPDIFKKTPV
jgi:hypothetical protein